MSYIIGTECQRLQIYVRRRIAHTRSKLEASSHALAPVDAASRPTRRRSLSIKALKWSRKTTHRLSTNHSQKSKRVVGRTLQEILRGVRVLSWSTCLHQPSAYLRYSYWVRYDHNKYSTVLLNADVIDLMNFLKYIFLHEKEKLCSDAVPISRPW